MPWASLGIKISLEHLVIYFAFLINAKDFREWKETTLFQDQNLINDCKLGSELFPPRKH